MSEEAEIGVEREVPAAPEKVFDREKLLTRVIDKLPGPLEVSLVVERM